MTKYYLHGGAISRKTEENTKIFTEVTSDLPDQANILCIYFSKEKEFWPELFEQDKINFSSIYQIFGDEQKVHKV